MQLSESVDFVIVLLLLGCMFDDAATTNTSPPREINPNGVCTPLKCNGTRDENGMTMRYMSGHAIENHTIVNRSFHSEMKGREAGCMKRCIAIPTCITVVVWMDEQRCWFYEGDDVYVRNDTIVPRKRSKIVTLGNGVCKTQPCVRGKCIPNYDGTGDFTCECPSTFYGKKCDVKGADLQFSFDRDTMHYNPTLKDLEVRLDKGRLIRVPDRRGKVLYMKDRTSYTEPLLGKTITTSIGQSSIKKLTPWFRSPFKDPKDNLTVSLWVKMDPVDGSKVTTGIIHLQDWWMFYERIMGGVGVIMYALDKTKMRNGLLRVKCPYKEIGKWTHIVFSVNAPVGVMKLYLNGEFCKSFSVNPAFVVTANRGEWKFLDIFYAKEGIAMLDELKFYNSIPESDDAVRKIFEKEKTELMS